MRLHVVLVCVCMNVCMYHVYIYICTHKQCSFLPPTIPALLLPATFPRPVCQGLSHPPKPMASGQWPGLPEKPVHAWLQVPRLIYTYTPANCSCHIYIYSHQQYTPNPCCPMQRCCAISGVVVIQHLANELLFLGCPAFFIPSQCIIFSKGARQSLSQTAHGLWH